MAVAISGHNDVKMYHLTAGKTLPEWLAGAKSVRIARLRKNDEFRRQIEIIHDFEFPQLTTTLTVSPDERYIFGAGMYSPQIRCWDTQELCLKFERHVDAEVTKLIVVSEDFRKFVCLQTNRSIGFHAPFGALMRLRTPSVGRDMLLQRWNADLVVCGSDSNAYRVNLEQGRFLRPFETDSPALNCCVQAPVHDLLCFGGSDGVVRTFDPRSRSALSPLDVGRNYRKNSGRYVSAMSFSDDGLRAAIGTDAGHVFLYDLRSDAPYAVRDNESALPIKQLKWFRNDELLISGDSGAVRFWKNSISEEMEKPLYTVLETKAPLSNFAMYAKSGLVITGTESPRLHLHFIPSLGPAPNWCPFLENITEELEEQSSTTAFDDYRFVTQEDLGSLGLSHLIGTNLLRAHMHGFFIDARLFTKAKAESGALAAEELSRKKIAEKVEKKRKSRIGVETKLPPVNQDLVQKIRSEALLKRKKGGDRVDSDSILDDKRFSKMFRDPDFTIDEESMEYKRIHTTESKKGTVDPEKDLIHYQEVEASDGELDESVASESEDQGGQDGDETLEELEARASSTVRKPLRLYALKDGASSALIDPLVDAMDVTTGTDSTAPLGERVSTLPTTHESEEADAVKRLGGGSRELRFEPTAPVQPEAQRQTTRRSRHVAGTMDEYERRKGRKTTNVRKTQGKRGFSRQY